MRASESMMLALPSERELAIDARPIPPAMILVLLLLVTSMLRI